MTKERAHSKFSASGAERWLLCPGSVALSEGQPDRSSVWAEEGTQAHKVLETILRGVIKYNTLVAPPLEGAVTQEMRLHGINAANFIYRMHRNTDDVSEILVESKIFLDFIHPEMFGTYDGAVIELFDTLHVFDYKYGAGHAVSPDKNLQMIFYALGLAHKYGYNFKKARLWIIQPRIKGYDGPAFWDISIADLKEYENVFRRGVELVENEPDKYFEGSHCHWCKAKNICPLKTDKRLTQAKELFKNGTSENSKKANEGGSKKAGQEKSKAKGHKTEKKNDQEKSGESNDFF